MVLTQSLLAFDVENLDATLAHASMDLPYMMISNEDRS